MTENKLPEGVGKKIVEALKKQSEIEITPIPELDVEEKAEELITEEVNETFEEEPAAKVISPKDEQKSPEAQIPPVQNEVKIQSQIQQPETHQPQQFQTEYMYRQPQPVFYDEALNISQQQAYREPQPDYNFSENTYSDTVQNSYPAPKEFHIPANVAVLKRLIAQLPQGVAKQTGAQIIRQTMEALGISMSTVLTEAQNFQDSLNSAVRDCVGDIQEYKNNIKNLEKQVSDYQKQSSQVNDLISLFIMTDK